MREVLSLPSRPELTWVGESAWVACDASLDHSDPHRVMAYLECADDRVYVLWVHDKRAASSFDTLREALDAIGVESHDSPTG